MTVFARRLTENLCKGAVLNFFEASVIGRCYKLHTRSHTANSLCVLQSNFAKRSLIDLVPNSGVCATESY